MALYKFLVIANAVEGKEDKFHEWYNQQHIPDMLKVPGFMAAQRFETASETNLPGNYVTIYDMETDDPQATLADMQSRGGTPEMIISDALDIEHISMTLLSPLGDKISG